MVVVGGYWSGLLLGLRTWSILLLRWLLGVVADGGVSAAVVHAWVVLGRSLHGGSVVGVLRSVGELTVGGESRVVVETSHFFEVVGFFLVS